MNKTAYVTVADDVSFPKEYEEYTLQREADEKEKADKLKQRVEQSRKFKSRDVFELVLKERYPQGFDSSKLEPACVATKLSNLKLDPDSVVTGGAKRRLVPMSE